jgi:hypothetical protein
MFLVTIAERTCGQVGWGESMWQTTDIYIIFGSCPRPHQVWFFFLFRNHSST